MGIAITLVLLGLKGLVQRTDFGRLVDQMSYDLLQHNLSSVKSAKDLNVMVLDISAIPMVTVPGIIQSQTVTSREPLLSIVESLVTKEHPPLAIGLDVDFSPDEYGYASPDDPNFFESLLQMRGKTQIPILVGVDKSLALGPQKWLIDPKYMGLASCIVVPTPEPGQSTRYMPEWLEVKYPATQEQQATMVVCPSMGSALAKASVAPVPWWAKYFAESTDLKNETSLSASEFLVDYSPLDVLNASAPHIRNSGDVAPIDVENKIVLIGRTRETDDTFPVPGRPEKSYAGVFLHACAAYTLLEKRPLYHLKEFGRIFIDLLFSAAIFGTVLLIRLRYARDSWEEFMEHRLQGFLTFAAVVLLVIGAVVFVRVSHLMWDDFLLVTIVLLFHSPVERTTGEFVHWLSTFSGAPKSPPSRRHSEEQK